MAKALPASLLESENLSYNYPAIAADTEKGTLTHVRTIYPHR